MKPSLKADLWNRASIIMHIQITHYFFLLLFEIPATAGYSGMTIILINCAIVQNMPLYSGFLIYICEYFWFLGIQTSDRTRANGAAKVSYSHTNWQNIDAESTRAKNPSNATCATKDSPIQGMYYLPKFLFLKTQIKLDIFWLFFTIRLL